MVDDGVVILQLDEQMFTTKSGGVGPSMQTNEIVSLVDRKLRSDLTTSDLANGFFHILDALMFTQLCKVGPINTTDQHKEQRMS